MTNDNYFLLFTQHFDRDRGQDYGRLSLNHLSEGTIKIWRATSSVASKQYPENFHERGGMIPPCYRTKNVSRYEVKTSPIPLPHVKGVEGSFYKIDPHFVITDKGGQRGDFGIHLDANLPGSLGCVVMNKDRFENFENEMTKLRTLKSVETVPLFVQYS